ncbi:efflux RND transporter permease subunit [Thalassotalea atypica]|uniref:efflux RND transporter permease subunit n=1 Tax=Thalassotalea atypica TaxID=2054316 RepID=UPI002572DABB|nr:MMPL family transporter [Thalassotalea atypica]
MALKLIGDFNLISAQGQTRYEKLLTWAFVQPKFIYSIISVLVLIALLMIPSIKIDTDPENMLSSDAYARVFHQQTKQNFAMRDMIVVGIVSEKDIFTLDNLTVIGDLAAQIEEIDGVVKEDLLSLTTVDNITQFIDAQGNASGIRFEYLMKQAPESTTEVENVRNAVARLPLLNNTLVASDHRAIAIYVPIVSKDLSYDIGEQIRTFISDIKAIHKTKISSQSLAFHITGLPIAEDQFGVEMFVQMGVAAPLAGLVIVALLWYFFRSVPLLIAPMIVAMATVIIIMGGLIGMGFTVHIMSSMIAIFLMPIAVVDSVHILSEFSDRHNKSVDLKTTIAQVMSHLYKPMLLTSVTSAVGFFSLMLTPIPPVQIFGAFIGSGILLAFALTIIFVPVYLSRLSPNEVEKLHLVKERLAATGKLTKMLAKLGHFATNKGTIIFPVYVVLFIAGVLGIKQIEINDNPINWFKANHEIRIADEALNAHFAGTYDAWFVLDGASIQDNRAVDNFVAELNAIKAKGLNIESIEPYIEQSKASSSSFFSQELLVLLDDLAFDSEDIYAMDINKLVAVADRAFNASQIFTQPDVLLWMSSFQNAMIQSGLVGKANTLNDIIKTVNRELKSGTEQDFNIPQTKAGVAQALLQYQSSHRPQDLWHFVSKDFQQSLMWLQMTSGDNQHTSKVVDWVAQYVKNNPAPVELDFHWAGKSYLNIVWQDAMVSGMADSLVSSFVIVFLMMTILFRSIKYGVLAMLPLTFTITMIYGLIGWLGKAYDMPIAVLSALTLGLSIDFAIHFLQRARTLIDEMGDVYSAMSLMFKEPATAITRNAIVIALGFTPLLFSPLVPYITVGFFLASIMALSALVTLILLPALLILLSKKTSVVSS